MLLTVVTINYNNKQGLVKTFSNIAMLKKKYDFEYVVIDGDSFDGSKDIIIEHKNIIDIGVSEKDNGIYDAMNKGVKTSQGEYICFLNSGDCFFLNDMDMIFNNLISSDADMIYGDYLIKNQYNHYRWKNNRNKDELWKGFFCHQSMFARKFLLTKYPFDERLIICADTDFVTNIIKNDFKIQKIDSPFAIIEPGGVSDIKRLTSIFEQWKVTRRKKIKKDAIVDFYFLILFIKNILIKIVRW